jgi:hypothetical protein
VNCLRLPHTGSAAVSPGHLGGRQPESSQGPESTVSRGGKMDAYCLKCREKREMVNPQPYKMKNGKDSTTGTCSVCGTKMFKIGKAATAA